MGSDYGIYNVLLDGKPPVAPVLEHEPGADVRPELSFDGYAYETYVGRDYQVGWPRLTKGRHTLTYVCLGKNAASTGYVLGVDNIVLAQVGAAGWAKAASVKPPVVPTDLAGATKALSDPDPVVRGLAARELRNMGAAAAPADRRAGRAPEGFRLGRPHGRGRGADRDRPEGGARRAGADRGGGTVRRERQRRARLRRGARRDRPRGEERRSGVAGDRGEADSPRRTA